MDSTDQRSCFWQCLTENCNGKRSTTFVADLSATSENLFAIRAAARAVDVEGEKSPQGRFEVLCFR